MNLQDILNAIVPQSAQKDYQAMKADPREFARTMQAPSSDDALGMLTSAMPIAGMAKVFKPSPVVDLKGLLDHLLERGEGLRRSSLVPSLQLEGGGLMRGPTHSSLYDALSPEILKRSTEGYTPSAFPDIFLTRDQGTIASSSLPAIKILRDNLELLLKKKK